jgi:predicted CXXCH cytochrome family protein
MKNQKTTTKLTLGGKKMKKLALLLVGIAIILPATVFAGVEGSDHDLSAGAASLCTTCHLPHNALGDNLWASTPDGTFSGVQDLCYTCHDGSVTSVGLTTAFDETL